MGVRLLRPLLGVAPEALRRLLTGAGVAWVEDPSNQDQRALRPRLRHRLGLVPGTGVADALALAGRLRRREEAREAADLARCATLRPEGFAVVSPERIGVEALRSLIATVGRDGIQA